MDPLGLSVADTARHLKVTRIKLSKLLNGKDRITPDMAVRLSRAFGGSVESWLNQQLSYDVYQARIRAADIDIQPIQRQPI